MGTGTIRIVVCALGLAFSSACAEMPSSPVAGPPSAASGETWTHTPPDKGYEVRVVTPPGLCRVPVDTPPGTIPDRIASLDLSEGVVVPCDAFARWRMSPGNSVGPYTTFTFGSGVANAGWTQGSWNRVSLVDAPPLLPDDKALLQKRLGDTALQMRANDRKRFARALEDINGFYEIELRQVNVRPESRSLLVMATYVVKGYNFRITTHSDEITADNMLALVEQQRTWARMLQAANR